MLNISNPGAGKAATDASKDVHGGCQKSGALHTMRKFYTSTRIIKRDSERERGGNRLLEMFL